MSSTGFSAPLCRYGLWENFLEHSCFSVSLTVPVPGHPRIPVLDLTVVSDLLPTIPPRGLLPLISCPDSPSGDLPGGAQDSEALLAFLAYKATAQCEQDDMVLLGTCNVGETWDLQQCSGASPSNARKP